MAPVGTQFVMTIEAVGRVTSSINRLYHFASGPAPSWDSDAVWVDCLHLWPAEESTELKLDTGRVTLGGANFRLSSEVETQQGNTVAYHLTADSRTIHAVASTDLAVGGGTVTLDSASYVGDVVVWGREVIYLDSITVGTTYSIDRGRLSTRDAAHDADGYNSLYTAGGDRILPHRLVTLYRVNMDTATSYSSLEYVRSYYFTGFTEPSPDVIQIEADSLLTALPEMRILREQWIGRLSLDAIRQEGDALTGAGPYYGDGTALGTTNNTYICLDGKGIARNDITATGDGQSSTSWNISNIVADLSRVPNEIPEQVWECFYCTQEATTSTSSLPLSRNLATLFLQILTTTESGTNYDSGGGATNYDVGKADLGLGIEWARVNISNIEAIRARLGGQLDTTRLVIGAEYRPVEVYKWLAERLRPHGIYIADIDGKLDWILLQDNGTRITNALVEADIHGPGSVPKQKPLGQQVRSDLSYSEVEVEYAYTAGEGTITDIFRDEVIEQEGLYGRARSDKFVMDGYGDAAGGLLSVPITMVQRFHRPMRQWDIQVTRLKDDNLPLGALVKVTHPKLRQTTGGGRGLTSALALVVGRRLDVDSSMLSVRLLYVGSLYTRQGLIAPAARVASWDAGTRILTLDADYSAGGFQSGLLTGYELDSDNFAAGYLIDLCDEDGVPRAGGTALEIESIPAASQIKITAAAASALSGASTTPADGNIIRLASYVTSRAQNDIFAHLADTGTPPTVGAANDDAYEYTLP